MPRRATAAAPDPASVQARSHAIGEAAQVRYWLVASADDLYRLLLNEVPEWVKTQAIDLLRRDRGEPAAEHAARLAEIRR